jgi:tetratricopeptide (TPR) repeat protein
MNVTNNIQNHILFSTIVAFIFGLFILGSFNFSFSDVFGFFHTSDNTSEEKKKTVKIDSPKGLWYNLGRFYSEQGNYTGSIAAFDRALSIDPNFVEALNSKAYVLRDVGNYSQAIAVFNQVLEKDPKHKWALNNIGYSLLQLGNISDSTSYFDKALEIDPEYQSALDNKATAMIQLGKLEEAKKIFEQVVKIYPEDPYASQSLQIINNNISNKSLASTLANNTSSFDTDLINDSYKN